MSHGWKSGRRFEPRFDASALSGECLRERRGQFRIRENGISEWGIFVHTREPFYHSGNLLSVKYGYISMSLTIVLIVVSLVGLFLLVVLRVKGQRDQREMKQHSITAEELHALLASNQEVLLFDVRQPLDLLAHSEIIPKAQRIPPTTCCRTHR
jgi:hypothetical protein